LFFIFNLRSNSISIPSTTSKSKVIKQKSTINTTTAISTSSSSSSASVSFENNEKNTDTKSMLKNNSLKQKNDTNTKMEEKTNASNPVNNNKNKITLDTKNVNNNTNTKTNTTTSNTTGKTITTGSNTDTSDTAATANNNNYNNNNEKSKTSIKRSSTKSKSIKDNSNNISKEKSIEKINNKSSAAGKNKVKTELNKEVNPTQEIESKQLCKIKRTPSLALRKKKKEKKVLVLDLDETLIHSTSRGSRNHDYMIEVLLDKHICLYYVYKRPYVDSFLKKVSEWYKVVVFTASLKEYADPVIDYLDPENKIFSKRYFRESCQYRNGLYMKDLQIIEKDLSKICLVDNSSFSYEINKENGIPIETWINDPKDRELLNLLPFLDALRFVEDVRSILSLRL
jgi:CTD nuclear envelope phosphatase 1